MSQLDKSVLCQKDVNMNCAYKFYKGSANQWTNGWKTSA